MSITSDVHVDISEVIKEEEDNITTEEFLRPVTEYSSTEVKGETPNVLFCTEAEIKCDVENSVSSNQKEYAEEEQHNDDYILGLPCSNPEIINNDEADYRLISDGKRNRFECNVCNKTFLELHSLLKHRKRHGKRQQTPKNRQVTSRLQSDTEINRFECNLCKRTFLELHCLQKHKKSHKKRQRIYIKYHTKSCLQSNGETNFFECNVCNKTFFELRSLRIHSKSHKKISHKCSTCDKEFSSLTQLRAHELSKLIDEEKYDKPQKCATCGKEYPTELSAHEIYHFNPMTFECNICSETFSGLMTLKRHVKEHKMKSIKCSTCSKTFSSPNDLKIHRRLHLKSKSFDCDVCDQSFVSLIQLKRHVPLHNKKPYKCFPCGKAFARPNQLENHEAVHLNSESWDQCGFCNKRFWKLTNLKHHLRQHHKKPYKCITCGKTFPFPKDLKAAYQILKLNPKLFECDICLKQFQKIQSERRLQPEQNLSNKSCSNTGLKEIVQLDSAEKQFKCTVCGKAFATSFGLQCHDMMHS